MRPLKLAQSKTTRAIFFFQMQFFSNIACNSFGAEIWGRGEELGRHVEKRKEKKKPIAQSLSLEKPRLRVVETCASFPTIPWSAGFARHR